MNTHILSAIHSARPGMTSLARSIVEAVIQAEGCIGSASVVARELGLRNRFELARRLRRDGLPPLHRLAKWTTLLSWVIASERGVSLCQVAFHSRRHPSACYRLVQEVTGLHWTEVRLRGSRWLAERFVREVLMVDSDFTRRQ